MLDSNDQVFPLPGQVGAIYQISANQWSAINQQAGVVVDVRQIAPIITRLIPNYPTLLPVCLTWQSHSYQALIAQAVLVGMFAAQPPQVLAKMRDSVASMADGGLLSASQQFSWHLQFAAFADHAGAIAANVAALAPEVAAFSAENQAADATLERIAASLPPAWQSIAGPLAELSGGFGALQSGWSDIAAQLQLLACGQKRFTTAGQVRAAVAAAIPAWNALHQSALAFDKHTSSLAA